MATAIADIRRFQSLFEVAHDDDLVVERLLQLLVDYPGSGKQVHDANLVATMLVHGVTGLLTYNAKDFQRFARLVELEPFGVP
jgi:predicted nucleic acid-binding protein